LLAKLSPNVADIVVIARAAMEGGADALTLINTLLGMSLDWRSRKPLLSTGFGGLSGPAIKPVALRMVHQVWRELKAPVVGVGGIGCVDDVMDFLVAGAGAVQVGTATFSDPITIPILVDELRDVMKDAGLNTIEEVVGSIKY